MKILVAIALMTAALVVAVPEHAKAQGLVAKPAPRITQLMSAGEAEATGVKQLSPEQIEALSAWLQGYRTAAEWLAVTEAQGEDMLPGDEAPIESAIDGDFDGWVGDTIFRLKNGQIWQQTSKSAKYLFAHAPRVTISKAPYRLRVEGIAVEIAVRRLR